MEDSPPGEDLRIKRLLGWLGGQENEHPINDNSLPFSKMGVGFFEDEGRGAAALDQIQVRTRDNRNPIAFATFKTQ